jgi:hypothetical protein
MSGVPAFAEGQTYVLAYGYYLQTEGAAAPFYRECGRTTDRHTILGATAYQQTPPDAPQWANKPVRITTLAPVYSQGKLRRRQPDAPEYAYWWVVPDVLASDAIGGWRVLISTYDTYGLPLDTDIQTVPTPTGPGWVYLDASPQSLGINDLANDPACMSYDVELQYLTATGYERYGFAPTYYFDTQYTPERYTTLRWLGRAGVYETFTFDGTSVETANNRAVNYDKQQSDVYGWQRDNTPTPTLATEGQVVVALQSGWVDREHYAFLRDLVGAVRVDILVTTEAVATQLGVEGFSSPQWLAMRITGSEWEAESEAGLFNLQLTVAPAPDVVYARD